jgi:hypothetical protein
MSLGYCKTFCRGLNTNLIAGQIVALNASPTAFQYTPDTPDRFKLVGISVSVTENTNSFIGSDANTVQTLKFYDGNSGSADSLILTFPVILGAATITAISGDFIMQDDSYVQIENGLYFSPSFSGMGNTNKPVLVTVFYV